MWPFMPAVPTTRRPAIPTSIARINELIRGKCDIIMNDLDRRPRRRHGPSIRQRLLGNHLGGAAQGMEAGAEMCAPSIRRRSSPASRAEEILMNTSPTRCRQLAEGMRARGIKPMRCSSPTHLLQDVTACLRAGLDEPPFFVNFVLGVDRGFQGAMPYSPKPATDGRVDAAGRDLQCQCDRTRAAGRGNPIPVARGTCARGSQDNLNYSRGELATNVEQVERIVRIIRDMGLEPATAAEARAIIGLPRRASTSVAA